MPISTITFEDEQEFKVLKALYGNYRRTLLEELETILNQEFNDGLNVTLNCMNEKGLIEKGIYSIGNYSDGVKSSGYIITKLGENKYHHLKKEKKKQILNIIIYLATFIAALVSAFGVFKSCQE